MSNEGWRIHPNDPAFPFIGLHHGNSDSPQHFSGATKREEFAKAICAGLCSNSGYFAGVVQAAAGDINLIRMVVTANTLSIVDALIAGLGKPRKETEGR